MQYTDNEAALIGGLISTYFFQPAVSAPLKDAYRRVLEHLQQHALYRSSPDIMHKHPQKLRSCRSCRQRAVSKAAQKSSIFMPGGAGKPVNVSDDLKRIGVVLVCHFRIYPLRWFHQPMRIE